MFEYNKVVKQIDEGLIDRGNFSWWSAKSFIDLMKKYLAEHPEKREHARKIIKEECRKFHVDYGDYYFPLFANKEDCLDIITDEKIDICCFDQSIFEYNQDPEVLEQVFAKEPTLVFYFLTKFPDKKDAYKKQILDFFYGVKQGKIEASSYLVDDVFGIFKEDTAVFMEMLDKLPLSYDLCRDILSRNNSPELIDKMLNLTFKQSEDDDVVQIYQVIARTCEDEKICQRILKQTDNKNVVSVVCGCCKDFSEDFQKKLLNHPKLTIRGLDYLSKYLSEIKLSDKLIDTVMKNSISPYNTTTEYMINKMMLKVLDEKKNPKTAEKILDYCMMIPHYGENHFSYTEDKVIASILKYNSSDAVINKLLDYAAQKMDYPNGVWEKILEKKVSKDILDRIFQESYHKCKVEIKQKTADVSDNSLRKILRDEELKRFYEQIHSMWQCAAQSTKDVALLDYILQCHEMLQQKIKGISQADLVRIEKNLNSVFQNVGYISMKLKQMFPRVPQDKAMERAFDRMLLTNDEEERKVLERIFRIPNSEFWQEYLRGCDLTGKSRLVDFILRKKEQIVNKLPEIDDNYVRNTEYKNVVLVEKILHEREYIKSVLAKKYPKLCFEEAVIREAARVVKSGDEAEKRQFNNLLLAEGEDVLLNVIDENVCTFLVDHFSQKNLDDVNALRSFYGLKIIVDETDFADANVRAVRRMQFDDSVSRPDTTSEYYPIQYSEAYRNFRYDGRRRFKPSDYYDMLDNNEAVQLLKDFGYGYFVSQLPDVLAQAKVPPEIAIQFNAKDLQAVVYEQLPDEEKEVYGWDGDLLFVKKWVKMEDENDEDDLPGAREQYWMDMVGNKQLVKQISDDLLRHGVSQDDVERLFSCAEEEGYPNFGGRRNRVSSVFLQLHHVLGLKDGGQNYPQNYAPVAFYPEGSWHGVHTSFSSHAPLHRYDTPKDKFYVVEGAKKPTDIMLSRVKPFDDAKAVRIRTVFTDDEGGERKKVLYYGGARKSSRYVGNLKGMVNIELRAKKIAKRQKLEEVRMKRLVQIVFQNVLNMQDKLKEKQKERENEKKRKKIEARKKAFAQSVKRKTQSRAKGQRDKL